jgi:hypothetical protein
MAHMEGLVKGKPIVKFFVMMGVIMSDDIIAVRMSLKF